MNISTDCQSTNSISLTLNKPGIFCHLKARGGIERGISPDKSLTSYIAVFQSNHYFMVSNENLGLQWSIELIIILLCWILWLWDHLEVSYFCHENLLVLGRKIFENPLFMTYMHNMHIKWKLITYQMLTRIGSRCYKYTKRLNALFLLVCKRPKGKLPF